MFGSHQEHQFEPISLVYEQKYSRVREMLSALKSEIMGKEQTLTQLENGLIAIKQHSEGHLLELEQYAERFRTRLTA